MPPDSYNPSSGVPLTRSQVSAQAIAAAGVLTMDAPVGSVDFITVQADMTGGAAGDLAITVVPYEQDGVTLAGASLPAVAGVGYAPAFGAGKVTAVQQYNVQGIDKVQVQFKNNNVGGQTINRAGWRVATW